MNFSKWSLAAWGIGSFFLALAMSDCSGGGSPAQTFPKENLNGEQLAHIYCVGCHQFPEPSRLDKKIWRERVLPHMAYRLGVEDPGHELSFSMQEEQQMAAAGLFPSEPLLDSAAWQKIVAYYVQEAPDSLPPHPVGFPFQDGLDGFSAKDIDLSLPGGALTCMLHWSPEQNVLFIGDGRNTLYLANRAGEIVDRFRLQSPPLAVYPRPDGGVYVLSVGHFHPNDVPLGQLYYISPEGNIRPLIEKLPRSVDMAFSDLDGDGQEDFVLCGFGNYNGRLSWFRSLGNQQFEENVLVKMAGAIKTYILDFNGDGRKDILTLMAQGDERILVHYNKGNGKFREELLLRFDPVFGSVYFEPLDFDADGDLDLLYVNGDNADFSLSLKPYHGIRLYENDGKNQFTEAFFFPLYGAFKAKAADFDADGDLDIAAIAFFPDMEKTPERGFVFLENKSEGQTFSFSPSTLEGAPRGRWITMESADFDGDEAQDLALGSFIFSPAPAPAGQVQQWEKEKLNVLLLMNKYNKVQ